MESSSPHAGRIPLGAWNAASWVATALFGFVVSALLIRRFGEASYGIWSTVAAFRGFVMFLDGGLAFGVSRDVVLETTEGTRARERIRAAFALYSGIAALALGVGLVLAGAPGALLGLTGPLEATARCTTRIVGFETALVLAGAPLFAVLRARLRYDVLAVLNAAQMVLGSAALALAPVGWGLCGAAAVIAVVRLAMLASAVLWVRRAAPGTIEIGPVRATALREVAAFALPLWIVAGGTELGLGTDVPIVGGFFGAITASQYALGAILPRLAAGLLFAILDAYFPRLAGATAEQLRTTLRQLVFAGCALAGAGFGVLALSSQPILTVWTGLAPGLSMTVIALYACTWALNVPAHVLTVVAIARGRHRALAPLVITEATVCFALSLALARWWRPEGPAVATLVTLFVSNVLVVPLLLGKKLELRLRDLALVAAIGYGGGGAMALLVTMATRGIALPGARVAAIFLGTAAGSALLLSQLVFAFRIQRLWGIALQGGWRVLLRERRERRTFGPALARQRAQSPVVWIPGRPPLVTVRIATYNRGRLVAERAIASALAQTHENLEVLVVGDHCDAETERAVLSVRDPRVRFENLPERGRYPANASHRWMVAGAAPMNRALEILKGEWIAPLDDDDEFTPDHVEVLLDACRTRALEFAWGVADMEMRPGEWAPVGSFPLRHGHIIHASVLYSARLRTLRHEVEAWRLAEPGDWNLWKRMRGCGVRMGFVDRVVCRHYAERRAVFEAPSQFR